MLLFWIYLNIRNLSLREDLFLIFNYPIKEELETLWGVYVCWGAGVVILEASENPHGFLFTKAHPHSHIVSGCICCSVAKSCPTLCDPKD